MPRREVQSGKVWEELQDFFFFELQDFAFERPMLTLPRALSMKWKGQEADSVDWTGEYEMKEEKTVSE